MLAPRPITSQLGECVAIVSLRKIINQKVCDMILMSAGERENVRPGRNDAHDVFLDFI